MKSRISATSCPWLKGPPLYPHSVVVCLKVIGSPGSSEHIQSVQPADSPAVCEPQG